MARYRFHAADFCKAHMPACYTQVFEQKARHPVQIENEKFWQAKIDYLHANPCRKGLVMHPEHWRFSSADYWLQGSGSSSDVILSPIIW